MPSDNGRGLATSPSSTKEKVLRFRTKKGKALAEQLQMCKGNLNEGDNLKSVYLTDGEIDYLIVLVLKCGK